MCSVTDPRFVEQADAMRAAFEEAFRTTGPDPLAAFDPAFRELAVDPFDLFRLERVDTDTAGDYRVAVRLWNEYMAKAGRHPACPNAAHVRGFVRWLRERDTRDVDRTLGLLGRAYRFWQHEPTLPHPDDYDPFERAHTVMGQGDTREPERTWSTTTRRKRPK